MIGIKKGILLPGIDIGASSVKFMRLSPPIDSPTLLDYDIIKIHERVSGHYLKALEDISKRLSAKEVSVSLSGPSVVVRYIEMPRMTDDELKSSMKYEAEKYIPFEAKDVVFDCQILENIGHGKSRVLLAAAKKEAVAGRLDILEKAGLHAVTVDCDAFALVNSFLLNYSHDIVENANAALVNLGDRSVIINILKEKTVYFTRESQVGGWDFTKAIAEKLDIDTTAASEILENPDARYNEILEIVKPIMAQIVEEIKISISYFEDHTGGSVSRIHLSGGLAAFRGLKEILSESLGLPCAVWNPFRVVKAGKDIKPDELDKVKSQMAIALGLALRR